MTDNQVEELINKVGANTAPRITPDHIKSLVVGETYTVLPSEKVMVCELTLKNGFSVRGEAAAVSKANFNETVGRAISYNNALEKIWQLEGYLLQQKLYESETN